MSIDFSLQPSVPFYVTAMVSTFVGRVVVMRDGRDRNARFPSTSAKSRTVTETESVSTANACVCQGLRGLTAV